MKEGKSDGWIQIPLGMTTTYRYEKDPLSFTVGQGVYRDNSCRVIFNNPATILFLKGKKYVSICKEERFKKELGLAMCLAKAAGFNYERFTKLLNSAKIVKNKN